MISAKDICIILTTTIHVGEHKIGLFQKDVQSRLNTYLKAVIQWLENSDFTLVLVENSGYTWNELIPYQEKYAHRFQIHTFDEALEENAEYLRYDQSKGCSELYAINYVHNVSELIRNSKFVIKVTGRFFIPGLQTFLESAPLEHCSAMRQNDMTRCEMVGSRIDKFSDIFHVFALDERGDRMGHVESVYKFRMEREIKHGNNVLVCDTFVIDPTIRGGVNKVYDNI